MEDLSKPQLIEGGLAVDDRGQLAFANNFDFRGVKRFYMVENFSLDTIRAWHGHQKEAKYAFVVSGSALVAAVAMDNVEAPSKNAEVYRFTLSARKPAVLFIPPGYANGFKSLEEGTKIIFFSTSTLEESKGDDHRFPADYWGNQVWATENR
ncbi:sugar epimerase [candidate division Kazan bacterium RBG_13_50_9]|uniref:Sugar epimerase n=1 Tax=candidate division Kazan bacterium RBG_13_50_9 TaxID=1798535 RepID=A0A1F4NTG8_UNCK3|nr:MAG: sugar epimerase [candidate division Kazan bacterium RBG_13_50_9]